MKPSSALLEAIELHERGALTEAAARYAEVLAAEPENVDALFRLGRALCQQGRLAEGAEFARKLIKIAPDHAAAHNLLGMALDRLGRPMEALGSFDRAVAADPDFADALANKADALSALGRFAEAVKHYDRALAVKSDLADAWCNRGVALHETRQYEEALASFDRAISAAPALAEAYANRAKTLHRLSRLDQALASFDAAIALRGDVAEFHSDRGLLLHDLRRHAEALDCLDRALALDSSFAAAYSNRGLILHGLDRHDEALASIERALKLDPALAQAYAARSWVYSSLGRLTEARADRERALALAPSSDDFAFDLALLQLLQGEWREGWLNYDRRDLMQSLVLVPKSIRRWAGEPLARNLLLLVGEQDLGDTIQFAHFAAALAEQGTRVTLVTQESFVPLLRTLKGVDVAAPPIKLKDEAAFTRWLPLMSVPGVLGTTPDSIPGKTPYLSAEPVRVMQWRARIGDKGFKVGICWRGISSDRDGRMRSVPLAEFAPLAALEGVRLISLQQGAGSEETAQVAFRDRIESFADLDAGVAFLDSAAVMMNLDLVVAGDSTIVHLAGALGRPAFVALALCPDWCWLAGREDSPWYPTLRLFRQQTLGDWRQVFEQIATAARDLASRG
ncbi:MAG: tetratricopeptide repeat protein [Xanthobacteraceae bacterium]|nr:tetratricopeptide repeat protein [Xanthobacteraceae bacterium]